MLEPKDIEILISKPKAPSVTTKSVALKMLGFLALMTIIGYVGLTSLCNITNPPPKPWILISNTNISNPDLASFKNCSWSEREAAIIATNESQPFSFAYSYEGEYRVVNIDTTKDPHFDDSAAYWGGLQDNGEIWSYYPCDIQRPPTPANANFLRPVRPAKPRKSSPTKKQIDVPTTKEMKRA